MWQKLKKLLFGTPTIEPIAAGNKVNTLSIIYKIFSSFSFSSSKQEDDSIFTGQNPLRKRDTQSAPKRASSTSAERASSIARSDSNDAIDSFRITPVNSSDSHLSSSDLESLRNFAKEIKPSLSVDRDVTEVVPTSTPGKTGKNRILEIFKPRKKR